MPKVKLPTGLDADIMATVETIRDTVFRVTESETTGLIHIDPQQLFDVLPATVRERIDLEDFRAVCATSLAIFTELHLRKVYGELDRYSERIARVTREG